MTKVKLTEVFRLKEAIPDAGGANSAHQLFRGGEYHNPMVPGGNRKQSKFDRDAEYSSTVAHSKQTADEVLNDKDDQYEDLRGKTAQEIGSEAGTFLHSYLTDKSSTVKLGDGNYMITTDENSYGNVGVIIDQNLFDELKDFAKLGHGMTGALHKANKGY